MDAKRRRSSLADFIKTERIKRNETAVEDIKSDVNNTQFPSADKPKIEKRPSQLSTIDDNVGSDSETSALYPLRIRREQSRHRRNSKWYDESRKNSLQDVIDKELGGIAPDEPNIDQIPPSVPRGYSKRRRFSVIQDNEGSSFTKEDKLRALEEEGGNQNRSLKSGRSRRTSRSTRTLNSIPSSSYPGSRSGSVNYDVLQESMPRSKGPRQESALIKNERRYEDLGYTETTKQDQAQVNERDVQDKQVIRVEITRGKSGKKQNNVVILQVGEPAKDGKDKKSDKRRGDPNQYHVSVPYFEDGHTKQKNNSDRNNVGATHDVNSENLKTGESFKNVYDRIEFSGNSNEIITKDNRKTTEHVTENVSSSKVTVVNDSYNIAHKSPKEIPSTEKEIPSSQELSPTKTSQQESKGILSTTTSHKDSKDISCTNTPLKDPKEILSSNTSHKNAKEILSTNKSPKNSETNTSNKDQKKISSKNTSNKEQKKISSLNKPLKDTTNTSSKTTHKNTKTITSNSSQQKDISPLILSRKDPKMNFSTNMSPKDQKNIPSTKTSQKEPKEITSTNSLLRNPKKINFPKASQEESNEVPSTNTSHGDLNEIPSTNTSHEESGEILPTERSHENSKENLSTERSNEDPKMIPSTNTSLKDSKENLSTERSQEDSKVIPSKTTSLKDSKENLSTERSHEDSKVIPSTNTSWKDSKENLSTERLHEDSKVISSTNTSRKDSKENLSTERSHEESKENLSTERSHEESKVIPSKNTSRKDSKENLSTDSKKILSTNTSRKDLKENLSAERPQEDSKEIPFTNTSPKDSKGNLSTERSYEGLKEIPTNPSLKKTTEIHNTKISHKESNEMPPPTNIPHNNQKENLSKTPFQKEIPSTNKSQKDPQVNHSPDTSVKVPNEIPSTNKPQEDPKDIHSTNTSVKVLKEVPSTNKSTEVHTVVHTQERDSSCDDRSEGEDHRHASNQQHTQVQILDDRETKFSDTQFSTITNKVDQTTGSSLDIKTDVDYPNDGKCEEITNEIELIDVDNLKVDAIKSVPQLREVDTKDPEENIISNTLTKSNVYNVSDKQENTKLDLPDPNAVNSSKCSSRMSKISNEDYRSMAASMKSLMKEEQECSEMFVKSLQDVRTHNAKLYKTPESRQFSEVAVIERWLKSQEIHQTRKESSKQEMKDSTAEKIQLCPENNKYNENDEKENPDIQKENRPDEKDGKEREHVLPEGNDASSNRTFNVPVEEIETHLENNDCKDQEQKKEPLHEQIDLENKNENNSQEPVDTTRTYPEKVVYKENESELEEDIDKLSEDNEKKLEKTSFVQKEILAKENPNLPSDNDEDLESKTSCQNEAIKDADPNKIDLENKDNGEKQTNGAEKRQVSNHAMEEDEKNNKNERNGMGLEVNADVPYIKKEVNVENKENEREDSGVAVYSKIQHEESEPEMDNKSNEGTNARMEEEENPDIQNQNKAVEKDLKGLIIEENHLEVTTNSTGNIDEFAEETIGNFESAEKELNDSNFDVKQKQPTDPKVHNIQMATETKSSCSVINEPCFIDESLEDINSHGHTKDIDDAENNNTESRDTQRNENTVGFAKLVQTIEPDDQAVYGGVEREGNEGGVYSGVEREGDEGGVVLDNVEEQSKIYSKNFETEQDSNISSDMDNQRLKQGDGNVNRKGAEDINSTRYDLVKEEVKRNNNRSPGVLSSQNQNREIADTPVSLEPLKNHESKSRKSSPKRIEILIRDDDKSQENELTVVIELPSDSSNAAENTSEVKEQSCQTDTEIYREYVGPERTVLPPLKCEPPLVQMRERSFIRLRHETTSPREELDPEVLYFIKQAERRQRSKVDDMLRELYQMQYAEVLRSPQKTCLDFPAVLGSQPRLYYGYSCDDFESMVMKANKFDNNVRRYLGYTKKVDRLQNIQHSKKYRAYMDLRKKLKHLY